MHDNATVFANGSPVAAAVSRRPAGISSRARESESESTRGPAAAIAAAVREGALSPVTVVERALSALAVDGRRPHGLSAAGVDSTRREATVCARRDDLEGLPLAGVPVAVEPRTVPGGSAHTETVGRVLRSAGAVPVGVVGVPAAADEHCDAVRAARRAVACGSVPLGYGNEGLDASTAAAGGGNAFAITPGTEVFPGNDGSATPDSLLASSVGDAALLLSVLAGRANLAEVDAPGRLRIGLAVNPPSRFFRVDRRWLAAAYAAASAATAAGHRVDRVELPATDAVQTMVTRWSHHQRQEDGQVLGRARRVFGRVAEGLAAGVGELSCDSGEQAEIRLLEFFERYDLVITPAPTPVRAEVPLWPGVFRFTPGAPAWRAVGCPSATMPMSDAGGPCTVARCAQVVGPPGSESTVLRLSAQLADVRPWRAGRGPVRR